MKTFLNSSVCAVTANSKSRWPHSRKEYSRSVSEGQMCERNNARQRLTCISSPTDSSPSVVRVEEDIVLIVAVEGLWVWGAGAVEGGVSTRGSAATEGGFSSVLLGSVNLQESGHKGRLTRVRVSPDPPALRHRPPLPVYPLIHNLGWILPDNSEVSRPGRVHSPMSEHSRRTNRTTSRDCTWCWKIL